MLLKIRFLKSLFLLFLSIFLISCGGGSGSGSGADTSIENVSFSLSSIPDGISTAYRGKREPVVLTTEIGLQLLEFIFKDLPGDTTLVPDTDDQNSSINETNSGIVSGYVSSEGSINPTGGKVTVTWTNYSNKAGYSTNGKVIYNVVKIDQPKKTVQVIATLNDFSVTIPGYVYISNGRIFLEENYEFYVDTTIFDLTTYEEISNTWYEYDRFKLIENRDIGGFEIFGRMYQGDLGYIDISTVESLNETFFEDETISNRPASGTIEINGAGPSKVSFAFDDYDYSLPVGNIEATFSDQDQLQPIKSTHNWRTMEPWQTTNTPPYLEAYLSTSFYPESTIDLIELTTYGSDEDRDDVRLTYTWYVNNIEVSNDYYADLPSDNNYIGPHILNDHYFKAGDEIKVIVTADDGFYSENEISTTIDIPEIYNTNPKIIISDGVPSSVFFTEYYSVSSYQGNSGILDASDSYDADGDNLKFEWKNSSNDQDLVIHSPNSSKTSVTCGVTYGCKNICLSLDVSEFRNTVRTNIHFPTLEVCFKGD